MHPITTSISWRDLPPEIRQRVICLTLNLGTSPLKQAWQQDRHKMADPKWKLRTYGDPDLGQYFHCPLLSPTPLHRLSKFSHQFNADLAASIPLMLRGMHARYDVLTQDQQANWSALLNSMKGWVDGDYNHPCNQYSGCSTQLEETDKMLKHMLDQVENNIDALKALECTIYRRKITRPLYIKMMPRRDALQFLLEHQCTTDIWTAITGAADSPLATPSKRWPSIHHTNADTRTTVAKVPGQVYGEDSEMNKTMRGYLELPPRTPSSENLED